MTDDTAGLCTPNDWKPRDPRTPTVESNPDRRTQLLRLNSELMATSQRALHLGQIWGTAACATTRQILRSQRSASLLHLHGNHTPGRVAILTSALCCKQTSPASRRCICSETCSRAHRRGICSQRTRHTRQNCCNCSDRMTSATCCEQTNRDCARTRRRPTVHSSSSSCRRPRTACPCGRSVLCECLECINHFLLELPENLSPKHWQTSN